MYMKKEEYIDKVIVAFKHRGMLISMDEIADYIGVTKKTLYNRFSSKDELITCCMERITIDFKEKVQCLDDSSIEVTEGFSRGITAMRLFFKDMSPVFFQDLIKYYPAIGDGEHTMGSDHFQKMLCKNIERGKREGVYNSQIDAELLSKYISFSVFAFFKNSIMGRALYSADHYFEQVINFNVNGLKTKD